MTVMSDLIINPDHMKKILLSATLLAMLSGMASGANTFSMLESGASIAGVSSNGRYAVGYNPNFCDASMVYMQSFLYDADTSVLEWVTRWDENDPSAGGQFCDVSDSGLVFGTSKDMDHVVTWVDEMFGDSFTGTTPVATVWDGGIPTRLPYGELDIDEFARQEDGTFGVAISGDGNTAIGYAAYDNMARIVPLMWKRGAGGGWSLSLLPVPANVKNLTLRDISGDGRMIIGGAYLNDDRVAVYWKDGVAGIIAGPGKERPEDFSNIQPLAVSNNGRFVVISINFEACIYDMETEEYHSVKPLGEYSQISQTVAIDDVGNLYGNYNGYPESRPFVYLYEEGRIVDMGYYLNLAVPGFEAVSRFAKGSQISFTSVTPDGRRFAGNTSSWGGSGWVMEIDPGEVEIPELPMIRYAFSRTPSSVTLRWNADGKSYGGKSLTKYNVYRNQELLKTVDAANDEIEVTLDGQPEGYPAYTVEAIFADAEGNELASPVSDAVKVAVTTDFSLPLKEFFDYSLESNFWTAVTDYGDAMDTNMTIFYQAGVEDGSGLYSTISSRTPYSFSLVSRPLDARNESSVKASFGFIYALLNDMNQILSNDFVSLEISTDSGDTWTEAGKWSLSELSAGNYCFKVLDISDLAAGKLFWMRIHREGDGSGMYISGTDNIVVSASDELPTPEGLTGVRNSDGSLTLSWKSPSGTYNLNHLGNLRTTNMAFANEGKEIVCANRFSADDLARHKGKYIGSVSALINYFPYQEDVKGIHASAVIYEDGEIIREKEFGDITYNDYNVAVFDDPLQIDGSKEMIIGIRLYDYDDWQWPAVAAVAEDYVPGKTDIYTEDGGKTWQRLSDLYDVEDIRGHCLWDITANMSDSPETAEVDGTLKPFIYTVYRDGAMVNVEAVDGNATQFCDRMPVENASYTVAMQSKEGDNSGMSAPYVFIPSGVSEVSSENADIRFDSASRVVSAGDGALRITLYDTDGRIVAGARGAQLSVDGLPAGLYVVAVTYADRILPAKLVIR